MREMPAIQMNPIIKLTSIVRIIDHFLFMLFFIVIECEIVVIPIPNMKQIHQLLSLSFPGHNRQAD